MNNFNNIFDVLFNFQNELERLKDQNHIDQEFAKNLLRIQIEENELKCQIEENDLRNRIAAIEEEVKLEEKIHNEVLFYYDNEIRVTYVFTCSLNFSIRYLLLIKRSRFP